MKKVFSLFLLILASVLLHSPAHAQARLKIIAIDSFPQFPGDTAYEGMFYHNIKIKVTNVGSSNFFGYIDVYLYSQSVGSSAFDTLRDNPTNIFLHVGDTATLGGNPNYAFRTIHYAAGDNIVVVWPFSGTVNFDTYDTRIYFSPLVGIEELTQASVKSYPNPVSEILRLNYTNENNVEQVRIYDLVGREIFNTRKAIHAIDVSRYNRGLYFLEITGKDGSHSAKKILVTD